MKFYLGRVSDTKYVLDEIGFDVDGKYNVNVMEPFPRVSNAVGKMVPMYKSFMMDSGAFTFRNHPDRIPEDIDAFIAKYTDTINKYGITKYIELDLDPIVDYDLVKEYRSKINELTGAQCIPAWHDTRGIKEFERMCEEYEYVAIGGFAKERQPDRVNNLLPKLLDIAKRYRTKTHALGVASLDMLKRFAFTSADSASWIYEAMHGNELIFENGEVTKVHREQGDPRYSSRELKKKILSPYSTFLFGQIHTYNGGKSY